jgi:hypothetical protein
MNSRKVLQKYPISVYLDVNESQQDSRIHRWTTGKHSRNYFMNDWFNEKNDS